MLVFAYALLHAGGSLGAGMLETNSHCAIAFSNRLGVAS
jgi:hypothetical protein